MTSVSHRVTNRILFPEILNRPLKLLVVFSDLRFIIGFSPPIHSSSLLLFFLYISQSLYLSIYISVTYIVLYYISRNRHYQQYSVITLGTCLFVCFFVFFFSIIKKKKLLNFPNFILRMITTNSIDIVGNEKKKKNSSSSLFPG